MCFRNESSAGMQWLLGSRLRRTWTCQRENVASCDLAYRWHAAGRGRRLVDMSYSALPRSVAFKAFTVTAATTPVSIIPAKPITTANTRADTCLGVKSP